MDTRKPIKTWLYAVICAAAVSACSSDDGEHSRRQSWDIDMDVHVPAATEVWRCTLVQAPATPGQFVTRVRHRFTEGSHHLLIRRTDLDHVPEEFAGQVECPEGGELMLHSRAAFYGSQRREETLDFPDGVGLPLVPGEVLIVQSHYVNPGAEPFEAALEIELELGTEEQIQEHAGAFAFYDPFIYLPPLSTGRASMRCPIPEDIFLLRAFSHAHKRGSGFEALHDRPGEALATVPFYDSADWDHASELPEPYHLAAGSFVRVTCFYDNRGSGAEVYQGQSALNDEMCMFAGLYYPSIGIDAENCALMDKTGVGESSCLDTLACVQACPPGSSPIETGFGLNNSNVDFCWQKCLASACENAAPPLFTLFECTAAQCSAECAEDPSLCEACVAEKCVAELTSCASEVCQ